jgi:F0F1-type ATP synthase membrane subunit c/vacuolar-type H+-ATPase subunit K
MKFKFAVAAAALLAGVGTVSAADLGVVVPEAYEPVPTTFWGNIELGGLGRFVTYNDDEGDTEEGTYAGIYGSFAAWGDLGVLRVGLDGYGEWLNLLDQEDDSDLTNASLAVLGAHVGAGLGQGYVGAFGALGLYPDSDDEERFTGYAVGIEGMIDLDVATLFGKVGYANAQNEGGDEEGFFGYFVEGGAIFSLSDQFAVQVSAGYGYSDPFDTVDDGPEDGYYATWGAKVAYNLGTEMNLNLVASYEGMLAQDLVDDEENVIDHTVKLGLSIPFGGGGAASALNPLASPTAPFRASVLADVM